MPALKNLVTLALTLNFDIIIMGGNSNLRSMLMSYNDSMQRYDRDIHLNWMVFCQAWPLAGVVLPFCLALYKARTIMSTMNSRNSKAVTKEIPIKSPSVPPMFAINVSTCEI